MNQPASSPSIETSGGDIWKEMSRLWERATGGGEVAARPTDDVSSWPAAPTTAGVQEAVDWLKSDSPVPRLLFLVGGPGAGKSYAAAMAARGLDPLDEPDPTLAERKYRFGFGDRELVIINDATITSEDETPTALARDIDDAISAGSLLLACVNRGVLVEERSASRDDGLGGFGSQVVNWLHDSHAYFRGIDVDSDDGPVLTDGVDEAYLRTATLMDGDVTHAEAAAVFVDACSLLEARPQVNVVEGRLTPLQYRVRELTKRDALLDAVMSSSDLFTKVIDRIAQHAWPTNEGAAFLDPFAANLASLSQHEVRRGVLTTLRASEIVAGTRLTFRDLWGAIARSVVGDAPERFASTNPLTILLEMQPTSTEPVARLRELQRLAAYRFSQSVFGVGADDLSLPDDALSNPVTRFTSAIDPVRDALPGTLKPNSAESGWATPIVEAFSGSSSSDSPLDTLRRSLDDSDPFFSAVTEFDDAIDDAFVSAMRVERLVDRDRMSLIAWYGRYLTRLYAISNGIPAFRSEIQAWTSAWRMSPSLPDGLESKLRTLLRPSNIPGSLTGNSLIPVLDSRTSPLIGEAPVAKLALESTTYSLSTSRNGDQLFLEVMEQGMASPKILLDFALIRQAMSCGAGWIGITEVSDDTSPRLERFRSARLLPGALGNSPTYVVAQGSTQQRVQVGGPGK
ncbi:hypothetical protein [Cryobacterium sp. BB736]|uniref:hypothetical protein n=1 Tax=Cryobacterium sp. BB736 TaxID=2746963 RepID=UPI001873C041|nr:hypothetical protein [Cryobacterium sp. BB736]